ncbi:MAG: PorT family protein, partial [Candidatus Aminicenantes bacterium]|nr:PorT family protein [Candidatus Aminicenantes bacterium]
MKLMVRSSGRTALGVSAGLPILLLLISSAAPAASPADQIQVGAHGGLSIPNIRDGDNEFSRGYTSRKGPFIGLFAEFRFHSNFFLRAEVNYASQGGKWDGRQPVIIDLPGLIIPPDVILYADFNNETILDYLEVPVLAGLTWGEKPRFFINAGP